MRRTLIGLFALALVLSGCNSTGGPTAQPAGNGVVQPPAESQTNPPPTAGNTPGQTNEAKPGKPPLAPDANNAGKVSQPPAKPPEAKEPPKADQTAYDQVDFQMTYEQVAKVMGQLGKLVHTEGEYNNGNLVEVYEYKHDKGTYRITFRNGKMNNKSATFN